MKIKTPNKKKEGNYLRNCKRCGEFFKTDYRTSKSCERCMKPMFGGKHWNKGAVMPLLKKGEQ
jgi:rRNA maturation endonuclease Nob1